MSIVEFRGGSITHRSLSLKSKHELVRMYLEMLDNRERYAHAAFVAGWKINAVEAEDPEHQSYLNGCAEVDWRDWSKI